MHAAEPDAIESFLRDRVTTYDQLEVLRLLYVGRETDHAAAELASALSLPTSAAEAALAVLEQLGLAAWRERQGQPRAVLITPPESRAVLEELMQVYETDRPRLMKILSQTAIARVRAKAAAVFTQGGRGKDGGS